jgi:hypothetical protein
MDLLAIEHENHREGAELSADVVASLAEDLAPD